MINQGKYLADELKIMSKQFEMVEIKNRPQLFFRYEGDKYNNGNYYSSLKIKNISLDKIHNLTYAINLINLRKGNIPLLEKEVEKELFPIEIKSTEKNLLDDLEIQVSFEFLVKTYNQIYKKSTEGFMLLRN